MEQELTIEAGGKRSEYWRDLWRYRELLYFLAWRDILVRYKQAAFGVAWAVLRPALTMLVFTFVFGKVAKLPSQGVPYASYVMAGMLPWLFFSGGLSEASLSLVTNANLVSKVYFPRVLVPLSALVVNGLDFCIGFVLLACLMAYQGLAFPWQLLFVLPLALLAFMACAGLGLLLAALNVRYRDFRYVVPFAVQFGMFVSPVGYGSAVVPEKWHILYALNPMVGVIDGMRYSLFGVADASLAWNLASAAVVTLALWLLGWHYFRRVERSIADVI
jgi:lipopolysaccharide transport system permease protein